MTLSSAFFSSSALSGCFLSSRAKNGRDEDLPLFGGTRFEPFVDGLVQDLGAGGDVLFFQEVPADQLPAERVVLEDGVRAGLHDAVLGIVVHQHAHDGSGGHDGPDQGLYAPVAFGGDGRVVQAGAVKGKEHLQPRLDGGIRVRGGIQGEIAALAVPGQVQGSLSVGGRLLQIGEGGGLGRDGRHIAHHEVFLPAHGRRVGAAVGDHGADAEHVQGER